MSRRHEVTVERVFEAPRALVWALVADTNRWDRASGLTPGRYDWKEIDGRRTRYARSRELGFDIEWTEAPYRWIEGEFIEGERQFLKGPVEGGGFRVRLADDGARTRAVATAWVDSAGGVVSPLIGMVQRSRFRAALDRFFGAIDAVLARTKDLVAAEGEPAVTRIRRALMGGYDPVTSGPCSPANAVELESRARSLSTEPVAAELVQQIVGLLRDRPDEELAQVRPFELARVWQRDRREVLSAFLHATRAGLVDLRWQINCPVCRVSAGIAQGLEEVKNAVHCAACNIDYQIDFGGSVEAVFQCNAAVREVATAVYCASSPAFLPHVWAQLSAPKGTERDDAGSLPAGALHIRSLWARRAVDVDVPAEGAGLEIVVGDGDLTARLLGDDQRGRLRTVNRSGDDAVLLLERAGWSADSVLGSVITSFPDFLDLFATEAPAAGVDLSIGHLALLFSDLTGSTAMYQRIGDARAFAIVEEHFRAMEVIVNANGGAVVKTMGDAVMATFPSAAQAVAAALAMARENERSHASVGLGVKLGVYAGPCLAVRANERLDFFGTTVNLAARLQAQAHAGQLVLTEEQAALPGVREQLRDLTPSSFEAALKGIAEKQKLVALDVVSRGQNLTHTTST